MSPPRAQSIAEKKATNTDSEKIEEYKNGSIYFQADHLRPLRPYPVSLVKMCLETLDPQIFNRLGPTRMRFNEESDSRIKEAKAALNNIHKFTSENFMALPGLYLAFGNLGETMAAEAVMYLMIAIRTEFFPEAKGQLLIPDFFKPKMTINISKLADPNPHHEVELLRLKKQHISASPAQPAPPILLSRSMFARKQTERQKYIKEYKEGSQYFQEDYLQPLRAFPVSLMRLAIAALRPSLRSEKHADIRDAIIAANTALALDNLDKFTSENFKSLIDLHSILGEDVESSENTQTACLAIFYFGLVFREQFMSAMKAFPTVNLSRLANPALENTLLPKAKKAGTEEPEPEPVVINCRQM